MANRIAIINHQAVLDIEEATIYYRQIRPSLELKFLGEVKSAIERIRVMPSTGSTADVDSVKLGSIQFVRLKRYDKYLLFYRTYDKHIEIIRVLHGSRAWQEMLDEDVN